MAREASFGAPAPDDFTRLHRIFVEHFGYAVAFAWGAALLAAYYAPWTRNIRALIDPLGRQESTASYLFALPMVMALALFVVATSPDALRRGALLKNRLVEFSVAGLVAFAVFCLAVEHAASAFFLGV